MKRYAPTLLILICAATFAFGVMELFKSRYQVGDVYPKYSSLRTDPLGTMAFYESLDRMPGVSVARDYSTANRLPEKRSTTYLHLAASPDDWRLISESVFNEVDRFVRSGGRLVITLYPRAEDSWRRDYDEKSETNSPSSEVKGEKETAKKENTAPSPKEKRARRLALGDGHHMVSIADRWGWEFQMIALERGENGVYEPAEIWNQSRLPLPETLTWHSGMVLTNLSEGWKTIYARGTNAVVAERAFGHGSVVLATDSFFLSNEAMLKDRHADLLAWLVGESRNVVFDEAHLGVTENPGVATLMRKYRLHWLTFSLIALAGLFIWKNSLSLVPTHDVEAESDFIPGKDASSGFVNLLRRNVPARELLAVCFTEWKKSGASAAKYSRTRVQEAEAIFQTEAALSSKDQNPIRAYQRIQAALENRKPSAIAEPTASEPRVTEPTET